MKTKFSISKRLVGDVGGGLGGLCRGPQTGVGLGRQGAPPVPPHPHPPVFSPFATPGNK